MVRLHRLAFLLILTSSSAPAQDGPLNPAPPKGITPGEIIQRFAAKETEFKQAHEQYTWRQTLKVETLEGNRVDGEFQQVAEVLLDDRGCQKRNVVLAPQSTLVRIAMTPEDYEDLQGQLPFVVTSDEIGAYNIAYVGQQQLDALNTYVFDLSPRTMVKGRRYFAGRIWVDDQDLQIVKTYGKNVPDIRKNTDENLFPALATYRELIDGHYWFPTYVRADDVLHFAAAEVHIRMLIKYGDYKFFGGKAGATCPTGARPSTDLALAGQSGAPALSPTRKAEPPPAPKTGTLRLIAQPGSVQIYLDNKPRGVTSEQEGELILDDVPIGAHKVRLSLPGYKDWVEERTIAGGETLTIQATLTPAGPKPLGADEVEEALRNGISKNRVTGFVRQFGVDFALTEDIEKRLRAVGADDTLLLAITKNKK